MPQPEKDLKEILQKSNGQVPTEETELVESAPKSESKRCPSREGKTPVSTYMAKNEHYQLKLLALQTGKSMHDLSIEAYNLLFELYDMPPIAK